MGTTDESYLPTGYEPKNYDLMETYVESLTESLTQPQFSQFSEQRFLESSSSVSERTGRPVVERTGRPVVASCQELNTEHAQTGGY